MHIYPSFEKGKCQKKKKDLKQNTKKPSLKNQHLVFLFPIKFQQFVDIPFEQQHKGELLRPLMKVKNFQKMRFFKKKRRDQINNEISTSSGRSTFAPPFSNNTSTVRPCPLKVAIKRGVVPSFHKKRRENIRKWKFHKKKKNK